MRIFHSRFSSVSLVLLLFCHSITFRSNSYAYLTKMLIFFVMEILSRISLVSFQKPFHFYRSPLPTRIAATSNNCQHQHTHSQTLSLICKFAYTNIQRTHVLRHTKIGHFKNNIFLTERFSSLSYIAHSTYTCIHAEFGKFSEPWMRIFFAHTRQKSSVAALMQFSHMQFACTTHLSRQCWLAFYYHHSYRYCTALRVCAHYSRTGCEEQMLMQCTLHRALKSYQIMNLIFIVIVPNISFQRERNFQKWPLPCHALCSTFESGLCISNSHQIFMPVPPSTPFSPALFFN